MDIHPYPLSDIDRHTLSPDDAAIACYLLESCLTKSAIDVIRFELADPLARLGGLRPGRIVEEGMLFLASYFLMGVHAAARGQSAESLRIHSIASEVAWEVPNFFQTHYCSEAWPDRSSLYWSLRSSLLFHKRRAGEEPTQDEFRDRMWWTFGNSVGIKESHPPRDIGDRLLGLAQSEYDRGQACMDHALTTSRLWSGAVTLIWPPRRPRAPKWLRNFLFVG